MNRAKMTEFVKKVLLAPLEDNKDNKENNEKTHIINLLFMCESSCVDELKNKIKQNINDRWAMRMLGLDKDRRAMRNAGFVAEPTRAVAQSAKGKRL